MKFLHEIVNELKRKKAFSGNYNDLSGRPNLDSLSLSNTEKSNLHAPGTDTALGTLGTKNLPIDADLAIYRDSESNNVLVTSTWIQIKTFLKTYFDTLYHVLTFSIIKPSADSISAIKITKANGITEVITVDTTNKRVGIDMAGKAPSQALELNAVNMQMDFVRPAISAITAALAGEGAGNVNNGSHRYLVAFVVEHGGQTGYDNTSLATITVVDKTIDGKVQLSNIPVSSNPKVVARKLYRGIANGGWTEIYYLATINDNTTTTYLDNIADASLNTADVWYAHPNTTSGKIYYNNEVTTAPLLNINDKETVVGFGALAVATGTGNVALGASAGAAITTGYENVFIGNMAGSNIKTGINNVVIGSFAGGNTTSSIYSAQGTIAIGLYALRPVRGNFNIAIGVEAGMGVTSGTQNVLVGHNAGKTLTTGAKNIFLGYCAGKYETGSNKIIIDSFDRTNEANQRIQAPIYGEVSTTALNQQLTFNVGTLNLLDALNIVLGTTTGTKIGTADTQKLAFYGATPVVRANHIADADGSLADLTTKFNSLLAVLEDIGILKTS